MLTATTLSFLSFNLTNSFAAYECKITLYGKGAVSVSFKSGKMNTRLAKPISGDAMHLTAVIV